MLYTLLTFHFEMSPSNLELANIWCITLTRLTSHLEISPLNSECSNMLPILSTFDVFHLEMSPLNGVHANILSMFVTCDTSHFEISPSKSRPKNKYDISVTLLMSRSFRSQSLPCSFILLTIFFLRAFAGVERKGIVVLRVAVGVHNVSSLAVTLTSLTVDSVKCSTNDFIILLCDIYYLLELHT